MEAGKLAKLMGEVKWLGKYGSFLTAVRSMNSNDFKRGALHKHDSLKENLVVFFSFIFCNTLLNLLPLQRLTLIPQSTHLGH